MFCLAECNSFYRVKIVKLWSYNCHYP